HYTPSEKSKQRREKLAKIATDILRKAGAKKVHRTDLPPNYFIHLQSTMRMGSVVDTSCEAYQVKRRYIADNSAAYNSLGGPNPTATTQALATRTAELLADKYFYNKKRNELKVFSTLPTNLLRYPRKNSH